MRQVTRCLVEKVATGEWGFGGQTLTADDVTALARGGVAAGPASRARHSCPSSGPLKQEFGVSRLTPFTARFSGRVLRDSDAVTTAERRRDAGQGALGVPLAAPRSPCTKSSSARRRRHPPDQSAVV
jgi:hypothetical protein